MNILVTGGAGYIGSVVVEELVTAGHRIVVLDNLSTGHRAAVHPEAELVVADLLDPGALERVLARHPVEVVMHLAAEVTVGASMSDPSRYFRTNVVGGFNLLEAMRQHGVGTIVFSSSAVVYGEPAIVPIREEDPVKPVSAVGESKVLFEHLLPWYGQAYGMRYISLRYFNAAGATKDYGEDHRPENHLIPLVLQVASGLREEIPIFGTDYPTPDGTCIRDYIHIADIARAHILALRGLANGRSRIYNLGNGAGYSVREVVRTVQQVTGKAIHTWMVERRAGDPAVLIASAERARAELGWEPRYGDLATIVTSAWEWHRQHPQGYPD